MNPREAAGTAYTANHPLPRAKPDHLIPTLRMLWATMTQHRPALLLHNESQSRTKDTYTGG